MAPLVRDRRSSRSNINLVSPPSSTAVANARDPSPRFLSLDPATFGAEHDVVWELTHNRDAYTGQKWVSLRAFPQQLLATLNGLRAKITRPSRPGLSPALACCIERGLYLLANDPLVQAIDRFRDTLSTHRALCGTPAASYTRSDLDAILSIIDSFRFTVPCAETGVCRKNFTAPTDLVSKAGDVALIIGMQTESAIVFAVALALGEQPSISPVDRDELSRLASTFSRGLDLRLRWGQSMLQNLLAFPSPPDVIDASVRYVGPDPFDDSDFPEN